MRLIAYWSELMGQPSLIMQLTLDLAMPVCKERSRRGVPPGRADDLRNVRIHVQPGERVVAQSQWIEEALLGETVAGPGPTVVAGSGGQIVEHLVHTAVFGFQDILHVLFGFRRGPI